MSSRDPKDSIPQTLKRVSVPELDAVLGNPFPVLDHGFIRVIDYMGSDASIVQAARVSYGTGTRSVNDDVALIRYLLRHAHTTPFEMCEIKLHVKLPIFVARQWIRHRTANVNEYSGRYSIIDNEFYVPNAEAIAPQSATNRQGRTEQANSSDDTTEAIQSRIRSDAERSYSSYELLLAGITPQDGGIARELARIGLGVNFYTQWYWKTDLHNLMHFLKLRADAHAQYEIRRYAQVLLQIVKSWVPATHQAFLDYQLHAVSLSSKALHVIRQMLSGVKIEFVSSGLTKREWEDLQAVLLRKE
jgi:thymidylate synthase (FAD)